MLKYSSPSQIVTNGDATRMDSRENLLTITEASQTPRSATEIWNRWRKMLHCSHFVLSNTSFGSLIHNSSRINRRSSSSSVVADSSAKDSTAVATSRSRSAFSAQEARVSLIFSLASQASSLSQRGNVSVVDFVIDWSWSFSYCLICYCSVVLQFYRIWLLKLWNTCCLKGSRVGILRRL